MITAYDLITEVMKGIGQSNEGITMKTISISNQKGGVGKTTTALCLSAGLAERGYRVLSIDLEQQRNLTATIGNTQSEQLTILDVLTGEATAREAIQHSATGDFIAGSKQLSLIDEILKDAEDKYTRLRDALKPLNRSYDYCIIDTPPALGSLTLSALIASNAVIVPVECDLYSAYGFTDLSDTIQAVRDNANSKLRVLGVLLTKFDRRTNLSREMTEYLEQITGAFNTTLFDTRIRHSIKAREIQLKPQGLFKYAPRHGLTQDYRDFTEEVIQRLK